MPANEPETGRDDLTVSHCQSRRGYHERVERIRGLPVAGGVQAIDRSDPVIAGRETIEKAYRVALEREYLWHEFGDLHLIV